MHRKQFTSAMVSWHRRITGNNKVCLFRSATVAAVGITTTGQLTIGEGNICCTIMAVLHRWIHTADVGLQTNLDDSGTQVVQEGVEGFTPTGMVVDSSHLIVAIYIVVGGYGLWVLHMLFIEPLSSSETRGNPFSDQEHSH